MIMEEMIKIESPLSADERRQLNDGINAMLKGYDLGKVVFVGAYLLMILGQQYKDESDKIIDMMARMAKTN